jgi:glycerol dehydrogenase
LPTTLDDIGLADASMDDLRKAALRTCKKGEFIHHEAADVSPDLVIYAMHTADQEGHRRKKAMKL